MGSCFFSRGPSFLTYETQTMSDTPDLFTTRLKTFGRRQGHKLRPRQIELLETLLPKVRISPEEGPVHPETIFAKPVDQIWFEIGFGGGEHAAQQLVDHPDVGLVACEPFINGVASLLNHVDRKGLGDRIRIYDEDARALLDAFPDHSLDRVFLLFPDPWRKKRHAKRRFVGPENLDLLARVMKPGAEFRLASDHMPYVDWALMHLTDHPAFEWICSGPKDWRERPADWPATRYEQKALKQKKKCAFLRFKKI